MVSSISSVRFGSAAPAGASVLDRPGAFSKPADGAAAPAADAAPKKKHKALKTTLGVISGLAVVAALLVAGNKTGVLKVLGESELGAAAWYQKAAHYVGVAGKWLAENTYDKVANLFRGAKA